MTSYEPLEFKKLIYKSNVSPYFTRSPFVTCMFRRAQSGRRTSFGRRVLFIKFYIILVISFFIFQIIKCVKSISFLPLLFNLLAPEFYI